MARVDVDPAFDGLGTPAPDAARWRDDLPLLLEGLLDAWELAVDGVPAYRRAAVEVPVRTPGGRPAALKVGRPRAETEHEHLALRRWAGTGAVELLRADPHRSALLLERVHRDDLTEHWDVEACEVVGSLYAALHVPAPPQLRTLASCVERWVADLAALPASAPLPHRMVQQAISIGRSFAADPASVGTLVHTDLHYATVRAADRAPWLAIDPEPLSGDPHYEVAPLLWNRFDELAGDVRRGVRARFHAVVDAAVLDEDRARDWVVLRTVRHAMGGAGDPADGPHPDRTVCLSIAKAVQD